MSRHPFPSLLRHFVIGLIGLAIIPALAATSFAENVRKTSQKGGWGGSLPREYTVHLPPSYDRTKRLPMVMMLHGCAENQDKFQRDANLDVLADQDPTIMVYPFLTDPKQSQNCWGWFDDPQIHRGQGQVEDLAQIIKEVVNDYNVDPKRIRIAGLSAGAAMAVDAMVAHGELFASGVAVAGLPYSETPKAVTWFVCTLKGTFKPIDEIVDAMNKEMGNRKKLVPTFIIHSKDDCMCPIQNGYNLRDSWGKAFGIDTAHPSAPPSSGVTDGIPWVYTKYANPASPRGKTAIETFFIEKLDHGWYGGLDGSGEHHGYSYAQPSNTSQLIWNFFKTHDPVEPPVVTITNATPDCDHHSIRVAGKVTVTDDGPLDKVTVKVELLGLKPQDARPAQVDPGAGTFAMTWNDLPDNYYYRPQITAIDGGGNAAVILSDPIPLCNPPHKPPVPTISKLTVDPANCCAGLDIAVQDDLDVISVDVCFDDETKCKWLPAKRSDGKWTYTGCGLSERTYMAHVRARNRAYLDGSVSESFTMKCPPPIECVEADIMAHMTANRIHLYSGRFGSADKSFNELFAQYSKYNLATKFPLCRATGATDWYAERSNIPTPTVPRLVPPHGIHVQMIEPPPRYDATQVSDLTMHMTAYRIRVYANGFGAADMSIGDLFKKHGKSEKFKLYRARGTQDWYADENLIPLVPRQTREVREAETQAVVPCCP